MAGCCCFALLHRSEVPNEEGREGRLDWLPQLSDGRLLPRFGAICVERTGILQTSSFKDFRLDKDMGKAVKKG